MRVHADCDFSPWFLRGRCRRAAVSECVYCGHPFCERHGERGPDFTDACARKSCTRKVRDLAAHIEWKRRVMSANSISVCAEEICQERMHHTCSRCRLNFCQAHVKEKTVTNRTVQPSRREIQLICVHCRERRKLWDEW